VENAENLLKCDGCGSPADEVHIRERIERLELSSRFRPIHISTLLLSLAPPLRVQDYFYSLSSARSTASQEQFRAILTACGISSQEWKDDEEALREFQRCNYFLASILECPLEALPADIINGQTADRSIASAFGPVLLKRLEFSLKPKKIGFVDQRAALVEPFLRKAGWGDRLLLEGQALKVRAVNPEMSDGKPRSAAEAG
jgi:hypothetical protein